MSILYICEKPSQARDIARNLKARQKNEGYFEGGGFYVTWCVGHLLALASPEYYKPDIKPWRIEKLPIIPKKWKTLITSKTQKQFNIIKKLLEKTNHVVIATDADREGEVIAREILEYCNYSEKTERLWLSALDDISIQKALKNIKTGTETEKLYYAGLGRQRADWLIGMNMTMAVSSLYGVNGVLSVGRVQTPTLKLVIDRDYAVESFIPKDYFILKVRFSNSKNESFWASRQPLKDEKNILDENGHCLERNTAEIIAAKIDDEPGKVQIFKTIKKKQKAPLCFSLSALQKKASALFGYSAKDVLNLAQSLYETHKAITYPRTDSGCLPEAQFIEAQKVIECLLKADCGLNTLIKLCDTNLKSSVWNDKKVTAHHAVIPTLNPAVNIGNMSEKELNIYDLIRRRYIAQFLGDYEYSQQNIEIICAGETFTASENLPINSGWKQAFIHNEHEKNENKNTLPALSENELLTNEESLIENKKTAPPARFTEGTLIEAMKNVGKLVDDENLKIILKNSHGIGTEATRANILEILFKRGYLKRQNKQIISTEKGRALIDLAPNSVKDPILTAKWEQQLDLISEGKGSLDDFVDSQKKLLHEMLKQLQNQKQNKQKSILQLQSETKNGKVYLCPNCQSPLRRIKNKKGKYFYGCSGYPNCKFTTWEKNNKPSL